jgi:hypothetical protein
MAGPSYQVLKAFLETAEAARRATRPLDEGTEVGVVVDGAPARFRAEGGRPVLRDEPAHDPAFTLVLPPGAVERLASLPPGDVGSLGVTFFRLMLERDPALHVGVRVHASTPRLLSQGWLGVLALGGLQVGLFLLKKGVANPRAAIDRLRGK